MPPPLDKKPYTALPSPSKALMIIVKYVVDFVVVIK